MNPNNFLMTANQVRMPKIIYGTAWKKDRTADLVTQALNLGFRGIDTACQPKHYHEAGVGEGIMVSLKQGLQRPELYLQSKFTPLNGQDPLQIPYDPKASLAEQVRQSFQTTLSNLQTDYLDCLLLHSPLADAQQTLEAWQAMSGIFESGSVKQLGISNCYDLKTLETLYQAAAVKPAVLQNRFYADTQYDRSLREFCTQHGMIYQSFWTLTANPHILTATAITSLAAKYQRTSAQTFFRYLSQRGIVPLTGATSLTHMQEDLDIFNFELSADECLELDPLF